MITLAGILSVFRRIYDLVGDVLLLFWMSCFVDVMNGACGVFVIELLLSVDAVGFFVLLSYADIRGWERRVATEPTIIKHPQQHHK